jgi:hypothetical protein
MCCSSNNKFDEFRTTAHCVDRGPGLGRAYPPPPGKADWGACRQAHDAELPNASPGQSQAEPGDAMWGPLKAAGLGAAHERPVSHLKVARLEQIQLVDAFVFHLLLSDVPPDHRFVSPHRRDKSSLAPRSAARRSCASVP